jgi:hypothetical protein
VHEWMLNLRLVLYVLYTTCLTVNFFWQNEVADWQWHFRFAELGIILTVNIFCKSMYYFRNLKIDDRN